MPKVAVKMEPVKNTKQEPENILVNHADCTRVTSWRRPQQDGVQICSCWGKPIRDGRHVLHAQRPVFLSSRFLSLLLLARRGFKRCAGVWCDYGALLTDQK